MQKQRDEQSHNKSDSKKFLIRCSVVTYFASDVVIAARCCRYKLFIVEKCDRVSVISGIRLPVPANNGLSLPHFPAWERNFVHDEDMRHRGEKWYRGLYCLSMPCFSSSLISSYRMRLSSTYTRTARAAHVSAVEGKASSLREYLYTLGMASSISINTSKSSWGVEASCIKFIILSLFCFLFNRLFNFLSTFVSLFPKSAPTPARGSVGSNTTTARLGAVVGTPSPAVVAVIAPVAVEVAITGTGTA